MSEQATRPTVRFGRLEQRGVLLGLSGVQLGLAGAAVVVATAALYAAGAAGLVASAPLWLVLLVAGTVNVGGRPLTAWAPVVAGFGTRRMTRGDHEVTPPTPPTLGSLQVPGVPGTLTVTRGPATRAALVWDRRAGTVCAIAAVSGSGFVLDEAGAQEHKVATWGRVLAQLCHEPVVVRAQVLTRTLPASTGAAPEWWRRHETDAGSLPGRILAELLEEADRDAVRHEILLVLAVRQPRGPRRRIDDARARQVESTLSALAEALAAAELVVDRWVGVDELPGVLSRAYDPATPVPSSGDHSGGVVVPAAGVVEAWDHLRTDSAVHRTFWVAQWPRTEVVLGFLQPLVLGAAWRTVSLVAEPLPTERALREIRRAHVEHAADAAHRAKVGMVEDEAVRAERADLAAREAELVAGHGDLRFTGLVTVTALDLLALDEATRAVRAAAAQAFCEVRPLVGQQAAAHLAGAVPLARGVR